MHKTLLTITLILIAQPAEAFVDSLGYMTRESVTVEATEYDLGSAGQFIYEYDFVLPKSHSSYQPELSLVYNSGDRKDASLYGYGWNLSIPYIERLPKEGYDVLLEKDYYMSTFSGELVMVASSTYAAKQTTDKKLTYTQVGDGWEVTDTIGTHFYFGLDAAARTSDPDDSTKVFRWYLERVVDSNGNMTLFSYDRDGGVLYPTAVSYALVAGVPVYGVSIVYEDTDPYVFASQGFMAARNKRIASLAVHALSEPVRSYEFAYGSGVGGRDVLTSITEVAYENGAVFEKPATTFTYSGQTIPTWEHVVGPYFPEPANVYDRGTRYGDLNGDGLVDIVRYERRADYDTTASKKYNYVTRRVDLNKGNGAWDIDVPWGWDDIDVPLLLSGDGVLSNSWQYIDMGSRLIDVNGDGLVDFTTGWNCIPSSCKNMWDLFYPQLNVGVYINNGSGFVRDDSWTGLWGLAGWNSSWGWVNTYPRRFADVNGDGLPDLVEGQLQRDDSAGHPSENVKSVVKINTGSGWEYSDMHFPAPFGWEPISGKYRSHDMGTRMADVNGDGLIDVLRGYRQDASMSRFNPAQDEVTVYLNTGSGWATSTEWGLPVYFAVPDYPSNGRGYHVIDINNDNLPDIVLSGEDSDGRTRSECRINTGSGWRNESCALGIKFNIKTYAHSNGMSIIDATGDGVTDAWAMNYTETWDEINKHTVQTNGGALYRNTSEHGDMLAGIELPSGGSIEVAYDGYLATGVALSDNEGVGVNPVVLSSVTYDDGDSGVYTETYAYEGGSFYHDMNDLRDRRFAGFGIVRKTTEEGTEVLYYHQNNGDDLPFETGDSEARIGLSYMTEVYEP